MLEYILIMTNTKQTRPRDYSKGKIYKLIAPDTDEVYIGSTIQTLSQRLSKHTNDARRWRRGKTDNYCYSELMLRHEGYKIELLYDFPCGSLAELSREEGETSKLFPTRTNKNVAGRTRKEWFADNNTTSADYYQKWYADNNTTETDYRKYNNPQKYKENNDKQNQKKKEKKLAAKKLKEDTKFKEDLETHELENEVL